ncbi:MAG: GIY-YIG nuclease family protein [Candidatus Shapirobacteria bacterium]|nr:GIY-YIG nuclease family protein [Candidatus Shapirobacteria bacterium]
MKFITYVLKNNQTGKIYIGQTSNLKNRIDRHNGLLINKSSSFTYKNKGKGKWILIYFEDFEDRKTAKIREKELKSCQGRMFIRSLSR